MRKWFAVMIVLLFLLQPLSMAAEQREGLQAAFVRGNDLWIKMGNEEMKVTNGVKAAFPKWSHDGQWLAYLSVPKEDPFASRAGELWLYHVGSKKQTKIAQNASDNIQWSTHQNRLAFQSNNDLYTIDVQSLNKPQKVSSAVINFSWLPDGKGFLTSSKAGENVYSDIVLTKIQWNEETAQYRPHPFYTIHVGEDEFFYGTSRFKWSPDQRWIAFQLVPTASLSADSNTLSLLSNDGKVFNKVGQMLNYEDWFQWAPSVSQLGYIQGISRMATENKKLTVLQIDKNVVSQFTPNGYVDRDLSWQTNHLLFVSRSKESKWADVEQRPLPSLYKIDTQTKKEDKITTPSPTEGDFLPQSVHHQLVWIRTNREKANVWLADLNGLNQKIWIQNIDLGEWYYEHWNWDQVFELYHPNEDMRLSQN